MRKSPAFIILLVFLSFTSTLSLSAQNRTRDAITGKWKVSFADMLAQMPPSLLQLIQNMDQMPAQERVIYEEKLKDLRQMAEQNTYNFKSNGELETVSLDQNDQLQEQSGKWSLSDDGSTISMETDGHEQRFFVKTTPDDKLLLGHRNRRDVLVLVPAQ